MDTNNNIQHSKPVPPFVRYCSAIIPTAFDDSLSYYEALCALWKWMQDNLVNVINNNANVTEYYIQIVKDLKSYVENYFDNLDVQEEINNKLDDMADSGVLADIMAEYAATKVDYFYIDSNSSSDDIKNAFASTKSSVIEFANGTYTFEGNLIISSNTTVNFNGATIQSDEVGVKIFFYPLNTEITDYNGVSNVIFNNGNIGSGIAMMHNSNIKFNNIEFLDSCQGHAVQLAGGKNIEFNSCTFDGVLLDDANITQNESLQLESCTYGAQPYLTDENSPAYNNLGNEDIRIKNCKFLSGDGINSSAYTHIGNHALNADNNYPVKNVIIENCEFGNCKFGQICPCGFDGAIIQNNTFKLTNEHSALMNIKFRQLNKHVKIIGNTFDGGVDNISAVNLAGYTEDLLIENNTFNTEFTIAKRNIEIKTFNNVVIRSNTFRNTNEYAIYLGTESSYPISNVIIEGNKFNNSEIASDSGANIYINRASYCRIVNNIFENTNSKVNITGNNTNASHYSIAGNTIEGTVGQIVTTLYDYSDIYDAVTAAYSGSAAYSALTSQTPIRDLTDFNTLVLTIHKNNDASNLINVIIKPYNIRDKIDARTWHPVISDGTNTGAVTFKVNADGTFDYSSSDSFTLRTIYAINIL